MSSKNLTLQKVLPWILLIAGVIGVFCAFTLSQDEIQLIKDPGTHLSCSLDPVVACGNVIGSHQAHTLGVPNPSIGLAAYATVATIGVAILAGAKFKRWFWLLIQTGLVFAVGYLYWLLYQSVYRIHNLCPYCLVIDLATVTSFWYVTLYNIDQKNIRLPKGRAQTVYGWIRRHHLDILILWFVVIAALVLKHFWYYYGRYF